MKVEGGQKPIFGAIFALLWFAKIVNQVDFKRTFRETESVRVAIPKCRPTRTPAVLNRSLLSSFTLPEINTGTMCKPLPTK